MKHGLFMRYMHSSFSYNAILNRLIRLPRVVGVPWVGYADHWW